MALRVSAAASLLISQDNAPTPAEPTFNSGSKVLTDASTYSYEINGTIKVPAAAVDQAVNLNGLTEIDVLYLFTTASGLRVKLVPVGGGTALDCILVASFPSLIGMKLSAILLSNPGGTPATVVIGAAGN